MAFDPADLPTDIDALHQIILAQAAEAQAREAELAAAKAGLVEKALEIEKYKLQIARLRLSFPKIPSNWIRTMRENQRIIRRDACHPPSAWGVCRRPV
jgi:hypothetical protein